MVNISIIIESHSKGMYVCEQFLKLKKRMGFNNVFIGCSLFNMYVKHGSKKTWHEMIIYDLKKLY
jgi:hypothetical protein